MPHPAHVCEAPALLTDGLGRARCRDSLGRISSVLLLMRINYCLGSDLCHESLWFSLCRVQAQLTDGLGQGRRSRARPPGWQEWKVVLGVSGICPDHR